MLNQLLSKIVGQMIKFPLTGSFQEDLWIVKNSAIHSNSEFLV